MLHLVTKLEYSMKTHASMNRIYRLVFNAALGIWVAVAENAKGRGKGGSAASALIAILAIISPSAYAANAADATRVGGTGTVTTVGNTTTINQTSQRLALDWTQLSTAANEALKFNQPNAQAIALNRITGSNPSSFLGSLTANGQVFILNPNGILFGAGSQVNVGGIVASTLGMNPNDFMNGSNTFTQTTGTGSVVNQGSMTAAQGGYLAMLAPEVRNEGVMTATLGTALLAAGNKVTLSLDNGSLLGYSIDQGAINALAENKQLIKADGGQVLLSAKAMDALTTATVNNTGVIEARTIQNKGGRILLMGDMEHGTVNVGGTLDASAPDGGNGGFIETSAAHVKVAAGTRVTTQAAAGQTGKWLIDPNDFTIAASGGDMDAATVVGNLATTNFEIQTATSGTSGGNGDIHVNEAVTWSSANTLTLTAERNININQAMTATNGGLTLNAVNQITAPAAVNVGTFTLSNGAWSQLGTLPAFSATDFRISGGSFLRATGGTGGSGSPYQIVDVYGLQGIATLSISNHYIQAAPINSGSTLAWNAGQGFRPIGSQATPFAGGYNGQNFGIVGLTINRPTTDYVGLFGAIDGGNIRNVNLVGATIGGQDFVGALAGSVSNTSILGNNSAVVAVAGRNTVGGLIGESRADIANSYAAGVVGGNSVVGGLIGKGFASITDSYASSLVTAVTSDAGGLAGNLDGATVSKTYANGAVASPATAGGLVGSSNGATVTDSYWNTTSSGLATSAGGTGKTSAEMMQAATYAGWDIASTGGSTKVWRIYEGKTAPILRSFLTARTLADTVVTYNGATQTATAAGVLGTGANGRAASTYTNSGFYSTQDGFDLSGGDLVINKANLVLASSDVTKTYDGGVTALGTAVATASTALLGSDTASGGSFAFTNKNAGTGNKTVTVSGVTVNDGNSGNNYNVSYANTTTSTINRANLTLATSDVTKTYDGGLTALGTAVATASTALRSSDTASGGSFAFADKNAGTGNKTVSTSGVTVNDGNSGNNYNVTYADNTASTITPKALTYTTTAANKVYDSNTTASATVSGLAGFVGLETVSVTANSATFNTKDVLTANTVTVNSATLANGSNGGLASNYAVLAGGSATAQITPRSIVYQTVTAANKIYDGNSTAAASVSNPRGLVGTETLTVTTDAVFDSKDVALTAKRVYFNSATLGNGANGGLASNYDYFSVNTYGYASITPKALTFTTTAANKVYDGSTTASATVSGLAGFVGLETVSVMANSASFNTKDVLTANTVTVNSATLANGSNGGLASNYAVPAGGSAMAQITPRTIIYLYATAADKVYDGNTAAVATVYEQRGFVGTETLTATPGATFNSIDVGTNKRVTIDSITLGNGANGGLASNYNVSFASIYTNANITPKTLSALGDKPELEEAYKSVASSLTLKVDLSSVGGSGGGSQTQMLNDFADAAGATSGVLNLNINIDESAK